MDEYDKVTIFLVCAACLAACGGASPVPEAVATPELMATPEPAPAAGDVEGEDLPCQYADYVEEVERVEAELARAEEDEEDGPVRSVFGALDALQNEVAAALDLRGLDEIRDACGVSIPEGRRSEDVQDRESALSERLLALMDTREQLTEEERAEVEAVVEDRDSLLRRARADRLAVLRATTDDECARRRLAEAQGWRDQAWSMQREGEAMTLDPSESAERGFALQEAAMDAWRVAADLTAEPSEVPGFLRASSALRSAFGVQLDTELAEVTSLAQDCPGELPLELDVLSYLDPPGRPSRRDRP